jgi:hypothetical protein
LAASDAFKPWNAVARLLLLILILIIVFFIFYPQLLQSTKQLSMKHGQGHSRNRSHELALVLHAGAMNGRRKDGTGIAPAQ